MQNPEYRRIDEVLGIGDGAWLGYHQTKGWSLLDRSFPPNARDFGGSGFRYFVTVDGYEVFELERDKWNPPLITYYRNVINPVDWQALHLAIEKWSFNKHEILKKLSTYIAEKKGVSTLSARDEVQALLDIATRLRSYRVLARRKSSPALQRDVELCILWANFRKDLKNIQSSDLIKFLTKSVGLYHASRLLSARIAENMASSYYLSIGRHVKDISVEQWLTSNDGNWKYFDLDVGYPIDVKNARPSFNGGTKFTQHCVPNFKTTRLTSEEVRIFGVISPYIVLPSETGEGSYDTFALGEISSSQMQGLIQWMNHRFGSIFSVDGCWDPGRIPGWLYEYPEEHYTGFNEAIKLIDDYILASGIGKTQLPMRPWLAVLTNVDPGPYIVAMPSEMISMIQDLRFLFKQTELTKRSLCLYLMGITLEGFLNPIGNKNSIETFKSIVEIPSYGGDAESSVYLGLCDPLEYVKSLIHLMECVVNGLSKYREDILGFRITHPDILQAKFKDGSVKPIFAYCGGWSLKSNVQCGYAPLVIGQHQHCHECGKLICHACGFCSKACPLNNERQKTVANDESDHIEDIEYSNPIDLLNDESPSLNDPGYWKSITDEY